MQSKNHSVKILKNMTLDITLGTGVFEPTGTSTEIAKAVCNHIISPGKTLILDVLRSSGIGFSKI